MSRQLHVEIDFGETRHSVGTLLYSEKMNRHLFEYEPAFRATGIEISPIQMPFSDQTFAAEYIEDFHGLPGVFADSLPDAWGLRVQDVEFEKIGILEPMPLDRLAFIGMHSMGALRYIPGRAFEKSKDILKYSDLRKGVQSIIKGDVDDVADELLQCGGSAGGARPKFLVDIDIDDPTRIRYTRGEFEGRYVPVLMKVPVGDDDVWQRVEYVYCQIAREATIDVPNTYLLKGKRGSLAHFAATRFGILPQGGRLHMATLAGIIGEPFRMVKHDYGSLLRTTAVVTRDHRDVVEAYRRMVFNYLGCNRDDHAKNFSFCMDKQGRWRLSPAYDIGFSKGEMNHNAMAINGKTVAPTTSDFRVIAEEFGVVKWREILGVTIAALKGLPDLAATAGIRETMIRRIVTPVQENIRRVEKDLRFGVEV